MITFRTCRPIVLALTAALPFPVLAADVVRGHTAAPVHSPETAPGQISMTISGRVAIIDGRTLWFPESAQKVRLAGIDACELPKWAYDPSQHGESTIPKPVPCGPFARAWLNRTVGSDQVNCRISSYAQDGVLVGVCSTRVGDLAIEMLRVGWARVQGPSPASQYLAWQNHAISARYGMWATYVLDMDEWRRKAVDRTLSRRPIADFNLLAEREREISPPFGDARSRPARRDR